MGNMIAENLSTFIKAFRLRDAPIEVVEKAKTCLINGIGIGISSHSAPEAKVAREIIKMDEFGISPGHGSTLFCDGTVVSTMGAAFANSVLFTERAQEDTLGATHVGVVVTPSVLAIGERNGISGKEVLEAIIVGYEIAGTLDRNLASFAIPRGFRGTPIFGIIGCAASASKLLRLTEQQITNALGFAAGFAGGNLESIRVGTKECRFQGGVAAREGILSALIAKKVVKAAPTAFEGDAGFFHTLGNIQPRSQLIGDNLGKVWEILNAEFKEYPVCAEQHTSTTITLELVRDNDIDYRRIKKVEVRSNPRVMNYPGVAYKGPFRSVEGTLMSLPFVQSLCCVEKDVKFRSLHRFNDQRILELIEKIALISDDSMRYRSSSVEITMEDGATYGKEVKIEPGYFGFDMERVVKLVKEITLEGGVAQKKVDRMISLVRDIEKLKDINVLTKLLARCP